MTHHLNKNGKNKNRFLLKLETTEGVVLGTHSDSKKFLLVVKTFIQDILIEVAKKMLREIIIL